MKVSISNTNLGKGDWRHYKNGNYTVFINLKSGSKIRYTSDSEFKPDRVENFDLKITNYCDRDCVFCHEGSNTNGKHADLEAKSFLSRLKPYTEVAIGGGNPLSHPQLRQFLEDLVEMNCIPSITVNSEHFKQNYGEIKNLVKDGLVYGVGVSLWSYDEDMIKKIKSIKGAVVHVIAGVISDVHLESLKNKGLKILILGYKQFRRGEHLYSILGNAIEENISTIKKILPKAIKQNWFESISFDNLALQQLDIKHILSTEQWEEFYMGDDGLDGQGGSASMYVDLVEGKYAKNSTSTERFDLLDDIDKMYKHLYATE